MKSLSRKALIVSITVITTLIVLVNCKKEESIFDDGLVLLSLQQEIDLGIQADSAIRSDPAEFPIMSRAEYPEVYNYFDSMLTDILNSDDIKYKEEFEWDVAIINKDVMNAFALPGGKMYFYTGLIKYLENTAQIAGVLAHEVAHIDRRHSNKQLSKAYGVQLLISLISEDNDSKLVEIAGDLAAGAISLQFSRNHEYEADEYSIKYLIETYYHPKGIEGFFVKLLDEEETASTFEFLSTHPSDQKRVDNINKKWEENGSIEGELFQDEYNYLINNLE